MSEARWILEPRLDLHWTGQHKKCENVKMCKCANEFLFKEIYFILRVHLRQVKIYSRVFKTYRCKTL